MAISVSLVVVNASLSYQLPAAAIDYVLLTVSTSLDTTGRYKLVQDSTVVLDAAVVAFGKALSDTATAGDETTLDVTKAVTDALTPTDDFARTVAYIRAFSDASEVSDTTVVSFIKAAFDSFTASDAITSMSFAKFLSDGVAMNDSFDAVDGSQYAFTKGVSNVVFASDSASRQVDYVRGFSDATGELTDTKYFDFVKSLADNTTTSDAGSLRSQGYCDFTYFAEDYVGDSRTF